MKSILAAAAALGALTLAAPAAAQSYHGGGWQPIAQRQAQLEQRIDQGVRRGDLTRREAANLRAEFNDIERLEARYRRDGLSQWERADLDRRMDQLSQRIRFERADSQDRGWTPINQRQRQLDARIDAGVRDGSLSRREAANLRAEFQQIAALEGRYRRDGLNQRERADLERRFDRLSAQIYASRNDRDRRRG